MRRGDFEGKRVHVVEEGNLARGVWTPLQDSAGWSELSARESSVCRQIKSPCTKLNSYSVSEMISKFDNNQYLKYILLYTIWISIASNPVFLFV